LCFLPVFYLKNIGQCGILVIIVVFLTEEHWGDVIGDIIELSGNRRNCVFKAGISESSQVIIFDSKESDT